MTSPDAVAFDVIGTLLDLSPLAARLSSAGVSSSVLTEWYERTLRDGFALSLAGDYVSFADVAASPPRSSTDTRQSCWMSRSSRSPSCRRIPGTSTAPSGPAR